VKYDTNDRQFVSMSIYYIGFSYVKLKDYYAANHAFERSEGNSVIKE
jgi:hypothetical protein